MTSYKPEVQAGSTGIWYGNGCAFATREEAEAYVRDLAWRWTAVRATRVVESAGPVTCRFVAGQTEWITP
jgi:hypothetical protein